jgi:hypothetical protein
MKKGRANCPAFLLKVKKLVYSLNFLLAIATQIKPRPRRSMVVLSVVMASVIKLRSMY